MNAADLEITTDPGTVWRVGFEPDPWAWTPWTYATDAGLFNGRWDDQNGEFRTLYTGASLLGCFLELLAKFRSDAATLAGIDQIDDPDNLAADDPTAPAGAVGYDWLEGRVIGYATQTGRYCFITHSRTIAALNRAGLFREHGITSRDVDATALKQVEDRTLTRSIARWVYDQRDEARHALVDGIEFRSRLGDEIPMWAIFERSSDAATGRSRHIEPISQRPVTPDTAELAYAFSLFGLSWYDPQ